MSVEGRHHVGQFYLDERWSAGVEGDAKRFVNSVGTTLQSEYAEGLGLILGRSLKVC